MYTRRRSWILRASVLFLVLWAVSYWYRLVNIDLRQYLVPAECPPCVSNNLEIPTSSEKPHLGTHFYRADGLVEVNPFGPHPIFELVSNAEKEWKGKLERASTSLEEGIVEYRRRYRRNPPKGFDDWWDYVKRHDVMLPDEYDRIYQDIEPFWGIHPQDLIDGQRKSEEERDSYTIGKTEGGSIQVVNYAFEEGRYDDLIKGSVAIIDLLKEVEQWLPPFRATFTPHDNPYRLSDYGIITAALEAARTNKTLTFSQLPNPTPNKGWISACPPTSPAALINFNLDSPPPLETRKTFIHTHSPTMNPCLHPSLLYQHGQYLFSNYGPSPQPFLIPDFSTCSTPIHHNIRTPGPYGWIEDIYPRSDDPDWDDRKDERVIWRGRNTGIYHSDGFRWRESHRISTVRQANDYNGTIDMLPSPKRGDEKEMVGEPKRFKKANINPAFMDIAFGGEPIACDADVCQILEKELPFMKLQPTREAGRYKYALDIDGNGWSGRFKRLLTSNSLILKSTIYPEWFIDRISPWVHYIPIQISLSDLHDILLFFRGDGNGDGSHDEMARKIAWEGREWSKRFWRREDLVAYFFRLMLEYSRVMSLDREGMTLNVDGVI